MEYKVVKKGYKINWNKISMGGFKEPQACSASSRNDARKILFNRIRYEGWCLNTEKVYITAFDTKFINIEVTYLNIPVVREPSADLYDFEGQIVSMNQINIILKNRNRTEILNNLLNESKLNPEKSHCYIKKGGWYYLQSCSGYTEYQHQAGIFTIEEGYEHAIYCDELTLIVIDIEEHNKMIMSKVNELINKLITN